MKLIVTRAMCRALSYCAAWISGNGCVPINFLMVCRNPSAPESSWPEAYISTLSLCRRTPLLPKLLVYSCGSGSSTAPERYVLALSFMSQILESHLPAALAFRTRARPSPHPPCLPSLTRKPRKSPKLPVSRAITFRLPSVT